jgi:hypothetical protein
MTEKREYSHTNDSIRKASFKLLERNHDLSPLDLCKLQGLSHAKHGATLRQYRMQWKREYKNRLGLKCLKFHAARGWVYALKLLNRADVDRLVEAGWLETRARNRMIIFKDVKLGRLEWHVSGRINIWVKKPASWGKLKQLLSNAFFRSGLLEDVQVFDLWANSARFKGAHLTFDVGERLPYARVDFLKDSLGVVVKMGDVSDPDCLEIEFTYPDWAERNEKILEQNKRALENFSDFLKDLGQPRDLKKDVDRSMVS